MPLDPLLHPLSIISGILAGMGYNSLILLILKIKGLSLMETSHSISIQTNPGKLWIHIFKME
jgi:hypothetical protein